MGGSNGERGKAVARTSDYPKLNKVKEACAMQRKGASLLLAISLVFLVVHVSFAGKVLFEDKFTTFDPAWSDNFPYESVKDGQMILAPPPNDGAFLLHAGFLPFDADI